MTEQEIKARNKSLCDRMPYLIPRNVWTDKVVEDYDYEYIHGDYELPDGWKKLFLQMCEDIRQPLIDANYLDKFRFSQIKEKYGSMRCYNFGAPSTVKDILMDYEYLSQFVCQCCGKPAEVETTGWVGSYCKDCVNKTESDNVQPIKLKLTYTIEYYDPEKGKCTIKRDVTDMWNRLYRSDEE